MYRNTFLPETNQALMISNNEALGTSMSHLSRANHDFVDTARDPLYARVIHNEIILATRFRIAVVIRRARDPSFISATPLDADGSIGGAMRHIPHDEATVAIMHLQGMRGSMMAPQDNPSACLDP